MTKRAKIIAVMAVSFFLFLVLFLVVLGKQTRTIGRAGGGIVSPDFSKMFVTSPIPPKVKADGKSEITVTVFLKNSPNKEEDSVGIGGKEVKLVSDIGTISPAVATTDKNGEAVFKIVSNGQTGAAVVRAIDVTDNINLADSVKIFFEL